MPHAGEFMHKVLGSLQFVFSPVHSSNNFYNSTMLLGVNLSFFWLRSSDHIQWWWI